MKAAVYFLLVAFISYCATTFIGDEDGLGSGELEDTDWDEFEEESMEKNEIADESLERISGGKNASITKYPFVASILINGTVKGGGSILNKRWLAIGAFTASFAHKPSDMTVRVGSASSYKGGRLCAVQRIVRHPHSRGYDNDLALVQLQLPLPLAKHRSHIRAVQISGRLPRPNAKVQFAGFGWNDDPASSTSQARGIGVLKETHLQYMEYKKCQPYYFDTLTFTKRCFCTAVDNSTEPEGGDFGSPVVYKKKVIGMFSGRPCGKPVKPAVFVDLTKQRAWISHTIKKYSNL